MLGYGWDHAKKSFFGGKPERSEVLSMPGIIVKAQVKEECRTMNVSADFYEKLDKKVKDIIKESIERARANKRTTVMGKDL